MFPSLNNNVPSLSGEIKNYIQSYYLNAKTLLCLFSNADERLLFLTTTAR